MHTSVPRVDCPSHPGSRTVRNGTTGTGAGRLQKYLCYPVSEPRHTFTLPLPLPLPLPSPLPLPGGGDTSGAARPPRSGPPRGHRYDADVIARGLLAVARGATLRQARIAVLGAGPGGGVDPKLVSRWLDSFGPAVREAAAADTMAPVIAVRAVAVGHGMPQRARRCLLAVVDCGTDPRRPKLWPVALAERPGVRAWSALLRRCSGRPEIVICETPAQEAAATDRWGAPAARLEASPSSKASSTGALPARSTYRRCMLWFEPDGGPDDDGEPDVVGHSLLPDPRAAQEAARAADSLLRGLAERAATIRSTDRVHRADLVLELMALELSGLATPESVVQVIRAVRS
jgi:hypothetical protein